MKDPFEIQIKPESLAEFNNRVFEIESGPLVPRNPRMCFKNIFADVQAGREPVIPELTEEEKIEGLRLAKKFKEDSILDLKNKRSENEARLVNGANLPKRHLNFARPDNSDWKKSFDQIYSRLGKGVIIGITGERGTGKTQKGVEVIKERIYQELLPCYFASATEIFIEIKNSFRKKYEEDTYLDSLRRVNLLVIDEFGKRAETDWENSIIFEILNKRHEDMVDTILIDNRSKPDFISAVGPSIASRMQEGGGIIEFNGKSFRA